MTEKDNRKNRIFKNLGNIGIDILSFSLMTSPVLAAPLDSDSAETATQIVTSESGKEVLNEVLKIARLITCI